LDKSDEAWMRKAISLASQAASSGEVPVGAVLIKDQNLIGQGFNQTRMSHDPTAHAEIIALRAAAIKTANYRLPYTTLYVTIEPCIMCLGALIHARVERVVIGALEPKSGAVMSHALSGSDWLNHRLQVAHGVLEADCKMIMQNFFKARRNS
jgi:tRNA(adenine34) deaminase